MTRLDIKDQLAHDEAEAAVRAFHQGGGSLAPIPALSPSERVEALERQIVEQAVSADRPSPLALRLITARAELRAA